MTNKMKYIIVDNGMYNSVIIFDYIAQHNQMALRMHAIGSVLGAGFVRIVDGKFECFGRSESLNIASRPEDSDYVNKFMGVTND